MDDHTLNLAKMIANQVEGDEEAELRDGNPQQLGQSKERKLEAKMQGFR